ncbi:hypothetical protein QBC39DRAFT_358130 [Podospora conica]|nr:hypothetical protein QBC39DRAFT_358130 [Schizothecium conicum]
MTRSGRARRRRRVGSVEDGGTRQQDDGPDAFLLLHRDAPVSSTLGLGTSDSIVSQRRLPRRPRQAIPDTGDVMPLWHASRHTTGPRWHTQARVGAQQGPHDIALSLPPSSPSTHSGTGCGGGREWCVVQESLLVRSGQRAVVFFRADHHLGRVVIAVVLVRESSAVVWMPKNSAVAISEPPWQRLLRAPAAVSCSNSRRSCVGLQDQRLGRRLSVSPSVLGPWISRPLGPRCRGRSAGLEAVFLVFLFLVLLFLVFLPKVRLGLKVGGVGVDVARKHVDGDESNPHNPGPVSGAYLVGSETPGSFSRSVS